MGPGGRLGFFTTSKLLAHHLLNSQTGRSTEPSGLSQAIIGSILSQWGQDGFVRWLRYVELFYFVELTSTQHPVPLRTPIPCNYPCASRGLRGNYRMRRDWTLDLICDNFDVREEISGGYPVFVAYTKAKNNLIDGVAGSDEGHEYQYDQKRELLQEKRGHTASRPLLRFVPPSAGMFLWLEVNSCSH